jgi:hypothetical protein
MRSISPPDSHRLRFAGEVIVSVATAEAAGMATGQLERRTVEIRGRTEPIEVIVLPAARQEASPDEPHI